MKRRIDLVESTINDCIAAKLATYKERAHDRNRKFKLTFDKFKSLVTSDCFYCGRPHNRGSKHQYNEKTFRLNGIDRIDNEKGYTEDNVVSACTYCNFSKKCSDVSSWIRWCRLVVEHTKDFPLKNPVQDEDIFLLDRLLAVLKKHESYEKFKRSQQDK